MGGLKHQKARLMTVPGVGPVVVPTFRATVEPRMDGLHLHRIALAVDEMFARVMKMELQQPIVSGLRGAHADARHQTRRHRRWNGQPSSGRSDRLIRVTTPSHARFSACG
jgi:hypothetical protein